MASSAATFRAPGLRQLQRDLRELGDGLGDLKDANAEAARIVAHEAERRAPKRTGRLAARIRGNRAAGRATVSAGGATVPYAGPIHYGWPAHHITANPFVIDAAQATEDVWLPLYEHNIEQLVDHVAGRTY